MLFTLVSLMSPTRLVSEKADSTFSGMGEVVNEWMTPPFPSHTLARLFMSEHLLLGSSTQLKDHRAELLWAEKQDLQGSRYRVPKTRWNSEVEFPSQPENCARASTILYWGLGATAENERRDLRCHRASLLLGELETNSTQVDQIDTPKLIINYNKFEGSKQENLSNMVMDSLSEEWYLRQKDEKEPHEK